MKLVKKSANKALLEFGLSKQRPLESERDLFKKNFAELLEKISVIEKMPKEESEEHLKNDVRDFLLNTYYKETNAINTKNKEDLVIYENKRADSDSLVVIEAKRPSNTNEMISFDNANKKALHELVFYYLNERNSNNFNLKHLIVTNIYEWFIVDVNQFDKWIYPKAKSLHDTKINDNKPNPFFYQEIERIIKNIDAEIPCVHFDIRDYKKSDGTFTNDKDLVALYKILSPDFLLKNKAHNDSNTLNEKFYNELLHIIGLEDKKDGGKNIIRRKNEKRNEASLIELVIDALNARDTFSRISDIKIYGENKEEQTFNIALELCITWVNRILFLKLLEGQLVSYQSNSDYKFLNSKTIHDFDELFNLFHKVLAVNVSDRTETIKSKYSRIPYLNSSLFDISNLERETIDVSAIENNGKLEFISTTILKDEKKKTNSLPTLEYLFSFLDCYDFASEGVEDWQKDSKPLINASVLGKVFEKINGYKDGSIFTPAFITMYMCRQSIRLAVVEKFNDALSLKGQKLFDKFDDIKNYTQKLYKTDEVLKANKIINSLHICDPAVGSGHFLVSALNELIVIKAELGILADENGNTLSNYEFDVLNDELVIQDVKGNSIEYRLQNGKPTKEIQRLQKTLFHEKQTLIENCLFGVDINPKSVLICRLRLWIELLKNAYYKEPNYTELETLPNIDINIKCGNSLISRFALDADLSKALKSINHDVKSYRGFVNDYKNEKSREVKKGLQKIIDNIKNDFKTEIYKRDPKIIRLQKLNGQLYNLTQDKLFKEDAEQKKQRKQHQIGLEKEIEKAEKEIEEIKNNAVYKNAFEWRFEFPEVLNDNGDFEGFDLIIENPPYVYRNYEYEGLKKYFAEQYYSTEGNFDLYRFFVEKSVLLTKGNCYSTLIIPNTFLTAKSYSKLRAFLLSNSIVLEIFDLGENVFEGITVENVILLVHKIKGKSENTAIKIQRSRDGNFEVLENEYTLNLQDIFNLENSFNIYLNTQTNSFVKKIRKGTIKLIEVAYCTVGINTGYIKDELTSKTKIDKTYHKMLSGRDIGINSCNWKGEWIKYDKEFVDGFKEKGRSLPPEYIFTKEKILVQRTRRGLKRKLVCYYDTEKYYNLNRISNIVSTSKDYSLKYVHALLNSSLMDYYFNVVFNEYEVKPVHLAQLPIKKISLKEQKKFIDCVDEIIALKKAGKPTQTIEDKIDEEVYRLYDLSPEEIELVKASTK